MRLDSRLFILAKDADQPSTFQDACTMDAERGVAAIADGVSSALFSGPWASILAEAAVADLPDPTDPQAFADWLQQQREKWPARIDTSSLAWFQRAKLPSGAFSTLLWLRVTELDHAEAGSYGGYRLRAHAIGDSCLFHVRNGELVRTFPLQSAAELDADPIVLGSVDLKRDQFLQFATLDEVCYAEDQLILCTDALAEWALRGYETGDAPVWEHFWEMSDEDWRNGILWLRQERQMRVDDSTMLLLRVVSQRVEESPAAESAAPAEAAPAAESALDWLQAASNDVRSVSAKIAEQADQTSERLLSGLKSFTERAKQKYKEKFGKKDPPKRK